MNLAKWKKAVVQLECAVDSDEAILLKEKEAELFQERTKEEITEEEFKHKYAQLGSFERKDVRTAGTAVFFIRNNRRYLITARHVLIDTYTGKRNIQAIEQEAKENLEKELSRPITEGYDKELSIARLIKWWKDRIEEEKNRASDTVFSRIFRVSTYNEYNSGRGVSSSGGIVGAWSNDAVMSEIALSEEADLAVISLDVRYKNFADELISLGYTPITDDDLNIEGVNEAEEIYTIGFPQITSELGEMEDLDSHHYAHGSVRYAVPVASFGRVAMYHTDFTYLLANMSVYPGNSGGPAIINDKLIGLISAQITANKNGAKIKENDELEIVTPFAVIIPSRYLIKLLRFLELKDEYVSSKAYLMPQNPLNVTSGIDETITVLEKWLIERQ